MKRKFSMFLNIAMLCLCVCGIAFGVYSAQQARLNISGNLGFTAHNAFVSVTGAVKNIAQIENDNVVSKTDMQIDKIVKAADSANPVNITMPLGDMYFYSNNNNVSAEDIVFELTFTNLGKTDIMATITKPSISSTISVIDNSDGNHGLYITFDENNQYSKFIMHGKSIIVRFALHLNDMLSLSTKISFNMPINFEDYQMFKNANNFFWNNNSNNTRTYVTMGSKDGKELRWYIFARGDGTNMRAVKSSVLNANKTLDAGTYWFISEYVLGVKKFSSTDNTYNGSTIQTYLSGTGASSFINKHGITAQDAVYSQITARTLEDAADAENHVGALTKVENQKLWLLSVSELKYLNNDTACDTKYKNSSATYSTIIAQNTTPTASFWWLRSPYDSSATAFYVDSSGKVQDSNVTMTMKGVRAAFQITI